MRVLRAAALTSHAGEQRTGTLTQVELEQGTGMSRPSVTNLIKRFRPVLSGRSGDGVRAGRIGLDPEAGVAVAVEVGHAHMAVAVGDLFGRIHEPPDPRAFRHEGREMVGDADAAFDWAVEAIERRLEELERGPAEVVAVAIGVAGPVDHDKGLLRAELSHGVDGDSDWQLFSARDHLRRRLGWDQVPFLLDNDANLSALGEHTWGVGSRRAPAGRTYRHAIYVEWSHGIGAGLILDGELYRGAGIAGELGHTIVVDDAPRCPRCGNPGCLDSLAGWEAISAEIEGAPDLSSALGMARSGHAGARRTFEDAAERMGRALGPLITVLNPELVIFGGSVGQQGYDVIKSPLLHALKRFTMRPALKDVEVVAALLHDRTVLRGAMALVLRAGKGGADPLVSYLQRRATELGDPALAARGRATEG